MSAENSTRLLVGLVVTLGVLLVWFGATIVRLENQNYAMRTGMCDVFNPAKPSLESSRCLDEVETRTSSAWHLFYALTD